MMYAFLLFTFFLATCAAYDGPPFCSKCSCTTQGTSYAVTCNQDIHDILFDKSYWIDSANNTYKYASLKISNSPFLTLEGKFPNTTLTYLSLQYNSIVNVSDGVFSNLQNLITLDLRYNNIELLHPDAFDGQFLEGDFRPLRSLTNLHLDSNRIHSLDADIFEHTSRLEELTLSHNPLKIIEHQTLVAITSLVFLRKLDLSYTELKVLPDYFLHTPKYLTYLDLSGNLFEEIPQTLEDSHNLTTLYFNDNPMVNITDKNGFPKIHTLKSLHFSKMKNLTTISKGSFSNLDSLEEFYCFENPQLSYIDKHAFAAKRDGAVYDTWPPIKRLYLQDNKLASIDMQLVLQWRDLQELDLSKNPWTCECENQWIVDELMPLYIKIDEEKAKGLKCAAPIEMVDLTFYDVYNKDSTMRCLDAYGHRPERDGALLVGILAGVLITIPLILFIIYSYQRHWFGLFDSSPAAYSRQFYKRTVSEDGYF